jgi:cytochrome P450
MLNGAFKIERPPRPKGKIISGSYFDFFQNQLDFLSNCAKNHGDIVYFRFFHLPIYLLNHPDLIEEVFSKNSANFRKAKTVRAPSQRLLFGNSLLVSEGDIWLRQRRAIQPAFHNNFIGDYSKIVVETAQEFINKWKAGETRLINEDLVDLTFAVASKTFFGIDGSSEKEIIRELINLNKSIFSKQNRFSWFWDNFLPTPGNLQFRKAIRRVNKLISNLIHERRAQNNDKKDLLSIQLSIENGETESLTEKQLRDDIITIFIAGHETTAVTLSWIWVLLAQHPEEFAKLQAELKEVLNGRAPTFSDLPKLRRTIGIIKESLRLYPPNRSTAREAINECKIGGYLMPAGAQVVMPQWVVHRDERFFDSPDEFIPDRWTEEFERRLHKYAYFPFGGGARLCIGRSFAMMEAAMILAVIAQKFQITLNSQEKIEPVPLVLLRPKNELKVTLKAV